MINLIDATYGSDTHFINVMNIVKNIQTPIITISNSLFGEDPHFGSRKKLTVKYLKEDKEAIGIFYEGDIVNLEDISFTRAVPYNASSHIPILSKCLQKINGTVIEFGSGFYSSNIINLYANLKGVKCCAYETFGDYALFMNEHNDFFDINYIKSYDDVNLTQSVDLLFIDQGPVERRKIDIKKYSNKENIKMMLLHDTEDKVYGYDSIWPLFKYTYHCKYYFPYTSLVSNYIDVTKFIE